jgi:hypothetical protein
MKIDGLQESQPWKRRQNARGEAVETAAPTGVSQITGLKPGANENDRFKYC